MTSSWLLTTASLAFTYATPCRDAWLRWLRLPQQLLAYNQLFTMTNVERYHRSSISSNLRCKILQPFRSEAFFLLRWPHAPCSSSSITLSSCRLHFDAGSGTAEQLAIENSSHSLVHPNNGAKFLAPLSVCTPQAAIHLFCMVLSLVSFSFGICRKETLEVRKFDEHVGTSSKQGGCSANGSCSHGRRLSRKTIRRGIIN